MVGYLLQVVRQRMSGVIEQNKQTYVKRLKIKNVLEGKMERKYL